jgi:myo-inositol 2-dehydrogenase/D-chiro-inositol 1-dehydrogenase
VTALREALSAGELGALRSLRLEVASPGADDLARVALPRIIDVIRALLGEIEALTATGDPPGERPDLELIVQLRAAGTYRAELRIWSGPLEPARLSLLGSSGSLVLEYDPSFQQTARLIRRVPGGAERVESLAPWDPHAAIFSVLLAALKRGPEPDLASASLHDGTRAMELSEATVRSLRRGRTVDLHYEPISEEATFKSVMTSTGCLIFIASMLALPLAMLGPPLGLNWTLFIPYLIPPVLVIFACMQALRLGIRRPAATAQTHDNDGEPGSHAAENRSSVAEGIDRSEGQKLPNGLLIGGEEIER